MIYIENKEGIQRIMIPTNDTDVEYVNFIPQEGDSDYYTKEQTNKLVEESKISTMNEVGNRLSHYATTDYVNNAVENVTVDLTGYATEEYVRTEIDKIPKPDLSVYYTKVETDNEITRKIDDALLDVPRMLENAGFATQIWVNNRGYATKQYVDDAVANNGGSADMSDYYTKGEIDSVEQALWAQINNNKYVISSIETRVTNIENNGSSGGGSGEVNWNNVPYIHVTGTAQFDSEIIMAGGSQSGDSDIASGIACAFKAGKTQSIDLWTRNIHAGTNGGNIRFVSSDEAGNTQLAMIDTAGNIYEGTERLSDKYATKTYVDDLIVNINNKLSSI